MSACLGAVVLSTPHPQELAAFYRELLSWTTVSSDPGWVRLQSPVDERPGLSFQLEPADTPPRWPATEAGHGSRPRKPATEASVQMQAHLDVLVDDLATEEQRAIALGARTEHHQPTPGIRVMRDPHGHIFCLFLPGS